MASSSDRPLCPSSPGPPVRLPDCIEELVRFTLACAAEGTLGDSIRLSSQYCASLLQEDDDPRLFAHLNSQGEVANDLEGVPIYPLYKRLARAIQRCIDHGSFLRTSKSIRGIPEDESLKGKEKEWSELVADKGSELLNMYKGVEFELHVQEPFFSQLRAGTKTVEGRCAYGNYTQIHQGVFLLFNKCLLLQVQNVTKYPSFLEMLKAESLTKVLPGIKTIEEGVQIYRNFYTEEREKSGVLAISILRSGFQPYISMGELLSGLGYEGINCFLGMVHTVGSTPDALPPPRSALLSSFIVPNRPDVRGCSLTNGARALSKHVKRCSNGWWGKFAGDDSRKNQLALEVINRLLTCSCWMNTHAIQPYDHCFEIRVEGGYGARWSRDGSKFIGFLEPYMEEGHSRRWQH